MKKKMTLWLLALLLLLTGCGATGGTEPTLQNSSDAIVSEDADQLSQTDITDVKENRQDKQSMVEETRPSPSELPALLLEQTPALEATIPPENSTFEVHYIDVGQGDCCLPSLWLC